MVTATAAAIFNDIALSIPIAPDMGASSGRQTPVCLTYAFFNRVP
jgi:hypothetical protein